jgi:hypothetical protein
METLIPQLPSVLPISVSTGSWRVRVSGRGATLTIATVMERFIVEEYFSFTTRSLYWPPGSPAGSGKALQTSEVRLRVTWESVVGS